LGTKKRKFREEKKEGSSNERFTENQHANDKEEIVIKEVPRKEKSR